MGIGTSEIEHILATQTLVDRLTKPMLIRIEGKFPAGRTAKDLVLTVLRKFTARGALGGAWWNTKARALRPFRSKSA